MKDPTVPDWSAKLARTGWWHTMELPGETIEGVRSLADMRHTLEHFPVPADLTGKRVLDIGAWDGWFTFEVERRGAEVTAVDCWDNPRFRYARQRLGSKAEYVVADVYELSPERLGRFDLVLFFGVLYHLKHPLLAVERVCALAEDAVFVESWVTGGKPGQRPSMEFYETGELGGQVDNWTGPNTACLLAFCRTAGFARVELRGVANGRAHVACYRRWEPPVASPVAAPELLKTAHNTDGGLNFSSRRDDYVSCWFRTDAERLSREDVRPEVAGYGSLPLRVGRKEAGVWQANFKLPPGLPPGWHEVRLRAGSSGYSNTIPIAVDLPAETDALEITGLADGASWTPGLLSGNVLSLWVAGLPDNADFRNVRVLAGGRELAVEYLSPAEGPGPRQINARFPEPLPPGDYDVAVSVGATQSPPMRCRVADFR